MIITVIKDSVIYNGKIYNNGDTIENANEIVAKSLIERGYVKEIDADEKELLTGHLDEAQLKEMSYQELKKLAAQMELDTSGKKEDLIARICNTEVSVEKEAVVEEEISGEETTDEMPNTSMPE